MNRRDILKSAGLLPLLPLAAQAQTRTPAAPTVSAARKRAIRVAYMGDTHITPDTLPMERTARCLQHIQNQRDKPAFILHGGDVIMDALKVDRDGVQKQWNAWNTVVKANNSLPIEYCIGNHDIWGFDGAKTDAQYGKKWATDMFKIANRYRSFEKAGWRFIILDSVQTKPDGTWYTGSIDTEQMEWLKAELAKTPTTTPILILSHIPLFSATGFFSPQNINDGKWTIPAALVVDKIPELLKLFYQYPNVKTCLSGHMHLLEGITYNNVQYFCNGAVCGNWWKEEVYQQTHAGYALFDLYDDGTVERTYVTYS